MKSWLTIAAGGAMIQIKKPRDFVIFRDGKTFNSARRRRHAGHRQGKPGHGEGDGQTARATAASVGGGEGGAMPPRCRRPERREVGDTHMTVRSAFFCVRACSLLLICAIVRRPAWTKV